MDNWPLAAVSRVVYPHSRRRLRPTFAADGGPDQLGAVVDAVREDARPVHMLRCRVAVLSDVTDSLDIHRCCTMSEWTKTLLLRTS
jgi:hypothetical protein